MKKSVDLDCYIRRISQPFRLLRTYTQLPMQTYYVEGYRSMNTNLDELLATQAQSNFLDESLIGLDFRCLGDDLYCVGTAVAERRYHRQVSVDLSLVKGTSRGEYMHHTWRQLLGDPAASIAPRLKRVDRAIRELKESPEYYFEQGAKENWSFHLVDGAYYISTGMHRTIVGRSFLELNGLPPVVHGVDVDEYVLIRTPFPQHQKPKGSFIRRLLSLAVGD